MIALDSTVPLDFEQPDDADADGVYEVTIRASDPTGFTELDVTLTVQDVDEAPVIEGLSAVDFAENSTAVVGEYTATDPEGDTIDWSVEGMDATSFTLTGGTLRFKSAPDFEMKRSYSVTVIVSDGMNDGTLPVTVRITNVVESGEKLGILTGLQITKEAGSLEVSVDWNDVDGANEYLVRWRLQGPDHRLNRGVRPSSSNAKITMADYGEWVVRLEACNGTACSLGIAQTVVTTEVTSMTPQNFVVSAASGALRLTATWKAAADATSYLVRWRQPGVDFVQENRVIVTATEATFIVSEAGEWVVRLEACKDDDCGPHQVQKFEVLTS